MIKIDRSKILNNFMTRIREAKVSGLSEIKMSVKELDDVGFVIYQIMAEKLSMFMDANKENKKEEQQEEEKTTHLYGGTF